MTCTEHFIFILPLSGIFLDLLLGGRLGRRGSSRAGAPGLVGVIATGGGGVALGALLFVGTLLATGDGVVAHLGEEDARVEDGEEGAADEDEGAVEDEEAGLVLHDVVAPAARHFRDTESKTLALYVHQHGCTERCRLTGRCIG